MINITASIDDGSVYDSELIRLFKSFRVPVTMYLTVTHVNLARLKGYPPMDEITETWIGKNAEIGSHTVTHPLLTRIDPNDAYNEIVDSKNMLESRFNRKITKFCYPRGYANLEIQNMVKEAGYESARSTLVGYLDESENPFFQQTTLHAGCNRKEYAGLNWFDFGIAMYEKAKEQRDAQYHIWLHGWEIYNKNGIGDLKRLLEVICK